MQKINDLIKLRGLKRGLPLFLILGSIVFVLFSINAFDWKKVEVEKSDIRKNLESLVKRDLYYIDEERVLGAQADADVFCVFKTDSEDYVTAQIVDADIKNSKLDGITTMRYPNGELYSGELGVETSDFLLRDGTKVNSQVVQTALTYLELKDGNVVPVEIFNGEIVNGGLTGIFSGRTISTGYQLAGYIENGIVKEGYLISDPSYVSPAVRAFAYLMLLNEKPDISDERVLPASTEFRGEDSGGRSGFEAGPATDKNTAVDPVEENPQAGTADLQQITIQQAESSDLGSQIMEFEGNTIVPDYDKGTYQISGLSGVGDMNVNMIRNIVNSAIKNVSLTSVADGTGILDIEEIADLISEAVVIQDESITGGKIKNDSLKNEDIAANAINSSKIEDGTITYSDIKSNTISTDDLASILEFTDGDLFDLSNIDHTGTSVMGLILPNVSTSSPSSPSSGEGYLAYDTSGDQVIFYNGSTWGAVGSGDITGVTAGDGLDGGGTSGTLDLSLDLADTALDGSTTSSVSGLEITSDGLSLLRGCGSGQVLKWNNSTLLWYCADDSGASGSGISTVEENNTSVITSATNLDFLGSDFIVTNAGGGEADVTIDYSNSHITRDNQTESVTGAWSFSNLAVSDTNIPLNGSSLTFDFNSGNDRTFYISNSGVGSAGLSVDGTFSASNFSGTSSGTNTGDQTITLTGDVTGSGTGSFATTISSDSVALTTDTTGNYVASITNGSGIAGGNGGSEGAALTLSLGALTSDWSQTGAFDIILGNADSQIQILESTGGTYYATLDAGDLSANAVYSLTGATGNIVTSSNAATELSTWDTTASDDLTTANYTTTLDSVYVNVSESPNAAGDISGDFTNGLTVDADSVALTTDTTGNYIDNLTGGDGITITGSAGEGWEPDITVDLDTTAADGSTTTSVSGLEFDGNGELSLIRGCGASQILKWDNVNFEWDCADDNAGAGSQTLQQTYEVGETISVDSTNGAMVIDLVSANLDIKSGEGTDTGDFRVWDGTSNWILVDESADTLTLGPAAGSGITIGGTGITTTNAGALSVSETLAVTGITTLTGNLNANGGLDVDDAFVVADGGNVSTISISDTSIALTGASAAFSFDAAGTRTFTITNADVSNVANLSVEGDIAGASITTGGDTIDEFAGTGLTVSSGDLQTTLGVSISNSELVDDTIDFDKIANSLTLDEATTITAGGALGLTVGNNVTLSATGTGAITATDLSCTDCIGSTEISALTLSTDTDGNYVASITNGSGIAGGNGGSEGAALTLSLGALTSDWSQTGAFDIILGNADSQIQILESTGGTYYATLDAGDLSANAVYSLTGATGNIVTSSNAATELSTWDTTASDDLTTANYTTTLDSVYVNVSESPNAAGDISGDFTNGLTVDADSVALTTDTTGNYIDNLTGGDGITITGSAGEGWEPDITVDLDTTAADGSTTTSVSGLEFDGNGELSLIRGCGASQILKWDNVNFEWDCADDNAGAGSQTLQQTYEVGETISVDSTNGAMVIDLVSANLDIKSGEGTDTGDFRVWDGTSNWILVDESADTLTLGPAAGSGITIGGTGITTTNAGALTVSETLTANGNVTIGSAASDQLTLTSEILGATPLVFEGSTDDNTYTTFAVTDPTQARTVTFRDASGTVAYLTDITNYWQLSADSTALAPYNTTLDLLVGSNATATAKFRVDATTGVINVGGGGAAAYNYFSDGSFSATYVDGAGDLYIEDELEVLGDSTFVLGLSENLSITNASFQGANLFNIQSTSAAAASANQNFMENDLTIADNETSQIIEGFYMNMDINSTGANDTVYAISLNNEDNATTDTDQMVDAFIYLNNSDATDAVSDGILFANSGGGGYTDYIDTPSSVFKVDGTGNITGVDLTLTGGNITLSSAATDIELIDNSTSALTMSLGTDNFLTFDTGDTSESLTIGNSVTNMSLVLDKGASGNITLSDFTSCTALETDGSGNLVCGSDAEGTGTNYWQLATDGLAPYNTTLDTYFGGTATAGAQLRIVGIETTGGNILDINSDTITTGNVADINSTSITSGKLLSLSATSNSFTTGTGLDINLTSTSATAGYMYGSNITVSDTGNVASGTENTFGQLINVTRTGGSGGTYGTFGLSSAVIADLSGNSSAVGLSGLATGADTNTGVSGTASNHDTDASNLYGGYFFADVSATGTVTNAYGVYSLIRATDASVITSGYGMYIDVALDPSITNNYGIYITDQSAAGLTQTYNLYSAGSSAKNYFAGLTGIGSDSTPDSKLEVAGGYAGNALVTFDDTFGNDILTASSSGTTKFTLQSDGDLILANSAVISNSSDGTLSLTEPTIQLVGSTAIDINSPQINFSTNTALTFADGDLIDLSGITVNSATEGLKLTQAADCSSQTAEGLICWDTDGDALYVGDGATATQIGGGGGALDTLTAATSDDTALLNGDFTIEWNWALTSATSKGITLGESAASTLGVGDQHILRIDTAAGSTAGPLEIVSNSADDGDIEINLNSDGDFEIQDGGTAFVVFDSDGVSAFSDDVTFTLAEAEDFAIDWSVSGTQSGQGEVLSVTNSSSSGNQYGLYLDNTASTGTTEALLVIDNSDADTAVTAGIQFVNAGGGMTAGIDMANLIIANIGAAGTDFSGTGGLTLADALNVTTGGATITAGGLTITAGALAVNSDSITSDGVLTIDANDSVVLGSGGNTFTFDESSGPLYAGTARPTKKITLSPEYSGAVITGDGANNIGTLTSDFCSNGNTNPPDINTGVCTTSGDLHNYYSWTTATSGDDYDIWVSYQMPSDFDAFTASDTIKVYGWNTDNTVNAVTVTLYDDNDAVCGSATDVATGTATWTQTALTGDETGCSAITAGDIITFRIQLDADASDYARVGEISFSYYAKF